MQTGLYNTFIQILQQNYQITILTVITQTTSLTFLNIDLDFACLSKTIEHKLIKTFFFLEDSLSVVSLVIVSQPIRQPFFSHSKNFKIKVRSLGSWATNS